MPTRNPTVAWSDHGNNTLEGRGGVFVDNDLSLAGVCFSVKKDTVAAAFLDELFASLEDVTPQTRTKVLCALRDDHRPRRRVGLQRLRSVCHVSLPSTTLVQSTRFFFGFFSPFLSFFCFFFVSFDFEVTS